MDNYEQLVKALRCREAEWGYYTKCEYYGEASDNRCVRCDSDRLAKDAAAAIEALQAEVKRLEPKRGEWELIDGAEPMRWGCSRCKYMSWDTSNYCPRCGAKMEVQE